MKKNYYAKRKEEVRNEAIDWQRDFCNHNYSYGELADFSGYFTRLGKRYGLLREFKENAIIQLTLSTLGILLSVDKQTIYGGIRYG